LKTAEARDLNHCTHITTNKWKKVLLNGKWKKVFFIFTGKCFFLLFNKLWNNATFTVFSFVV